ncbi:calmodulin, putative [Babesia ovis]|uniref:Calmodulin, putative n=1 Tax=Babesia ovis TaxID=5869 RepID=A0A9W5TF50_BABOV|nr:calmodulin, putative [Babesia ovis]
MDDKAKEAALLFGGNTNGVLSKNEAIDVISAMGIAVRDTDSIDVLGNEVTYDQLVDMAKKMKSKQYTAEELAKLFNRLNPHGNGTISRGTLVYILKTNHHIPDDQVDTFLSELKLTVDNGMVRVDELVKALLGVLT